LKHYYYLGKLEELPGMKELRMSFGLFLDKELAKIQRGRLLPQNLTDFRRLVDDPNILSLS
jgi:hypothetical protein